MKNTGKILFLISFILAFLTAGLVYLYLGNLDTEEVVIEKMEILVAAVDIEARTLISEDMLKTIKVYKEDYNELSINDKSEIVGKYAKENIYVNEKIYSGRLIELINEELSLMIDGNYRALSISVDGQSGVSDLIKSGDFIDIFVYLPQVMENQRIVRPDITKLLLQKIEVLGIDKNLYRNDIDREEIPSFFNLTVAVPIQEIEKLVLAEDIGNLKVVLRPFGSEYLHKTDGTIWQELLLDDYYQMKDMFPTYEMKSIEGNELTIDEYEYTKYVYYTVKYGDTLRSISKDFFGNEDMYRLIMQANKIEDEDLIYSGTAIKIPVLEGQE